MDVTREVPESRIRIVADLPPRRESAYVLYWMIAARRLEDNHALQRAVWWARELDRPLVVLEALRVGYRWASDRLHTFVIEGMRDHAAAADAAGLTYLPYVEPTAGAGRGLLATLASDAAVVVTDDFPTFFLPAMIAAAGRSIGRRLEAVDANGLLPMRATDRVYPTAYAFRRYVQKTVLEALDDIPVQAPLASLPRRPAPLPAGMHERWPMLDTSCSDADVAALVAGLPIDHGVGRSEIRGGAVAARAQLDDFLATRLDRYHEGRNDPDTDASSGLSPYLHFGHVAAHRVFADTMTHAGWTRRKVAGKSSGQREGWWQAGAAAEAFVDELVTWRELGFNCCANRPDHDQYDSLPDWARASLDEHADDPREHVYALEQFARAETHDEIWNAAQRQLASEGRIHNYLRMLWGKKILEWSGTPREALAIMIELNNRYALDGRDPNSYSGIFWVLGRYDRPWAPRRPVFGVIRYMSSANTRRKLKLTRYLELYGEDAPATLF